MQRGHRQFEGMGKPLGEMIMSKIERKQKDPTSNFTARLRVIFKDACKASDDPRSVPSVQNTMLQAEFMLRLDGDQRKYLMAIGLGKEIRDFFKEEDERNGAAIKAQIEMWPQNCRGLVSEIDRERIFVPSLGEFVPLLPNEISREQVLEAGQYLVKKGEETIRVGKLIVSLSKKMK
jgi:hypothetical protein